MRFTSQALAAALLAVAVIAPVDAAAPGGSAQETITGVLETVHVDALDTGLEHEEFTLRSAGRVTRLEFPGDGPVELTGATVTLAGTRTRAGPRIDSSTPGHSLRVTRMPVAGLTTTVEPMTVEAADGTLIDTTAVTTTPMASATAANPIAKNFAIVLINFTDVATQPFTPAAAQNAITGPGGVKAFYEEGSKGAMTVTGTVFGWYPIAAATAGCDWRTWHTLGYNAAVAAGANLAAFTNVFFVFPNTTQCQFAGIAYVTGKYGYINGTLSVQVLTHELGHNFGLGHSNALECVVNGIRVAIAAAANCTERVYADPFSTMGNNALRHHQGSQLGELGWLAADEKMVGAPGNTYTITPWFAASGVHLVRVPRGDGFYFDLDIRATYGVFDTFSVGSPPVAGVSIRLGRGTASPTTGPLPTQLLDTTPATTTLADAPLLVGRTLTDPVSGISISAMALTSDGIEVRIRENVIPSGVGSLTATPTGAPAVDLGWTAATDNVALGGYRVSRDGVAIATTAGSAAAFTDTGVDPGTTYTYTVIAVDTSGNAGPSASAVATTPGVAPVPTPSPSPDPAGSPDPPSVAVTDLESPSRPGTVTVSPASTTITLSWEPATDDVGVTAYRVARGDTVVATVTGTTWRDVARLPLTLYGYSITAVDSVGHEGAAATVSVRTLADTTRPSTPTGMHVHSRRGIYVSFDWANATDNVRVVRYAIYRVGKATPIGYTSVSYMTIGTVAGAKYYVRAIDAAGNRSYGSTAIRGR